MTILDVEKKGNKRSTARLAAVQALYQMDAAGSDVDETIQEFTDHRLGKEIYGDHYAPADAGYFSMLVREIVSHQLSLDPQIDDVLAKGWPMVRLDLTLRQILRAGLYELMFKKDVPAKAVISEYVDVANGFFDKGDGVKIANGVLDKLARQHRADEFSDS